MTKTCINVHNLLPQVKCGMRSFGSFRFFYVHFMFFKSSQQILLILVAHLSVNPFTQGKTLFHSPILQTLTAIGCAPRCQVLFDMASNKWCGSAQIKLLIEICYFFFQESVSIIWFSIAVFFFVSECIDKIFLQSILSNSFFQNYITFALVCKN